MVAFTTEYCSYCRGLKELLDNSGVDYTEHCIDADESGVAKQEALTTLSGCFTVPQLFVDGNFVGGFTEAKNAWKAGSLSTMLCVPTSHI